jgi:hypothetical protein
MLNEIRSIQGCRRASSRVCTVRNAQRSAMHTKVAYKGSESTHRSLVHAQAKAVVGSEVCSGSALDSWASHLRACAVSLVAAQMN